MVEGTDGTGIVSTEVRYQIGTNWNGSPTGTWVNNPPAPQKESIYGRELLFLTLIIQHQHLILHLIIFLDGEKDRWHIGRRWKNFISCLCG